MRRMVLVLVVACGLVAAGGTYAAACGDLVAANGAVHLVRTTTLAAYHDGVEHYVVLRDVTMDSHPAYTGEKRLVDTAGRVEKFTSKFKRSTKK